MDPFCFLLFLVPIKTFSFFFHTSLFDLFSNEHKVLPCVPMIPFLPSDHYRAPSSARNISSFLSSVFFTYVQLVFVHLVTKSTVLLMGIFSDYMLRLVEMCLTAFLDLLDVLLNKLLNVLLWFFRLRKGKTEFEVYTQRWKHLLALMISETAKDSAFSKPVHLD